MNTFVFLQVGDDPMVNMLIKSIKAFNIDSKIIQCSDYETKKFEGVSDIFRIDSNKENLMTFRLEAFSKLSLTNSAIYLDTDILVLRDIPVDKLLGDSDVALCHRSFGRDNFLNTNFKKMNLSEYKNKTLEDVYPILACFTIAKSHAFWGACLEKLYSMDEKFHFWYGDQEAMREIAKSGEFSCQYLNESEVACLPEYYKKNAEYCLHFKGAQRKLLMNDYYDKLFSY